MNASEMLAMIDDRISDGKDYPTLEEYSQALAQLDSSDGEYLQYEMRVVSGRGLRHSLSHEIPYNARRGW
jgi:hypothetical protein